MRLSTFRIRIPVELEHEELDHAEDRMMIVNGFQHLLQLF